ncbi:MAG TPA: DUF1440 domain-containing protein [Longimicrobiales bacterium]|nr:DUF1440 domain-containing protein [Longimicrobiales bacterium]
MGRSIAADLVKGAIAGAVATYAMDALTRFLYEHESEEAREEEEEARGGATAYEVAAERGAEAVGAELTKKQRRRAGTGLHWGLGVGAGAVYGVIRTRVPFVGEAEGVGFGSTFFLLIDEGVVPLLGLTPGPAAFPWQTHVRGLAGHVVFGMVADATLRALDRVT